MTAKTIADVASIEGDGTYPEVILHEMAHVLGFGSLWGPLDLKLIVGSGTTDPFFIGRGALDAFPRIGGWSYPGNPVPAENTGGAGTANSHWRETVLGTELMTGFITLPGNPMSVLTVASMGDLGYSINLQAAQPFSILPSLRAQQGAQGRVRQLVGDAWEGPLYRIDETGKATRLR